MPLDQGLRALVLEWSMSSMARLKLVLVVLAGATVFSATVGKNPQESNPVSLEERQDAVVEYIGGDQSVLTVVELDGGELRVGIDEGLLVDSARPFEGSDIERILGSQIARMPGFDLTMGFFLVLGLLQGDDLALGEEDPDRPGRPWLPGPSDAT